MAGHLTDRAGQRTALVVMMTFAALSCVAPTWAASLPALLIVSVCLGLTMETYRPAVSAAINTHIASAGGRARAQTALYWSINVGIAVCGGLGGYAAHHYGYRPLFVANAVVCAAFALLAWRLLAARKLTTAGDDAGVTYRQVLADPTLRWIAVVSVAAMVCAWGLVSVLPLLMTSDGLPPTAYGTAMIANTVAVLVLTPPMTRLLIGRGEDLRFSPVAVLAVGTAVLGAGYRLRCLPAHHPRILDRLRGPSAWRGLLQHRRRRLSVHRDTGRRGRPVPGRDLRLLRRGVRPPLGIAIALNTGGRPLVAALLAGCALLGVAACLPLSRALRNAPRPH
ncbi:MFS transporter [Actinacidiphila glaucinigra]|uniref:Major Facilitator Superfamily protein n=1 Tax=Actinacidiphila glaucinigra TaxID=235986 RepID=A0A239LVM0_9ACTN|nr:MFS transporter [Actinacidiphila glaucinigra]SNT34002.1 Major Facilitator Superfamily protein [Actinacidiphila glaucinigra]